MKLHQRLFSVSARGQGLRSIDDEVAAVVEEAGLRSGLCTIMVRHTSASLLIQENADPSARRDLEDFFARLVPEGDPRYSHSAEGPDDMPAHIRGALTQTSLSIPLVDGRLGLGTWQGIYLWEHRHRGGRREIIVQVLGEP